VIRNLILNLFIDVNNQIKAPIREAKKKFIAIKYSPNLIPYIFLRTKISNLSGNQIFNIAKINPIFAKKFTPMYDI